MHADPAKTKRQVVQDTSFHSRKMKNMMDE
jgi:hypothetical protein